MFAPRHRAHAVEGGSAPTSSGYCDVVYGRKFRIKSIVGTRATRGNARNSYYEGFNELCGKGCNELCGEGGGLSYGGVEGE